MLKVVALLRRKPGLTREQFITYYETRHAPLIRSLLPEIREYRRNYVELDGAFDSEVAQIDFDSLTEMRFADRAAYERFLARAAQPEVAQAIADDEENVFDRAATRMFVVDEVPAAQSASDAQRIEALEAERALREGLARFARILDTKDWAALTDVFAPDLTFDYGMGEQTGLAALTDNMRRFLDVCGPTQHLIGSITTSIENGAQAAVTRAYVQARHQRADDQNGPVFDTNGEYVDRWERRPAGWRIVRRDALWFTNSGDPAIIWK